MFQEAVVWGRGGSGDMSFSLLGAINQSTHQVELSLHEEPRLVGATPWLADLQALWRRGETITRSQNCEADFAASWCLSERVTALRSRAAKAESDAKGKVVFGTLALPVFDCLACQHQLRFRVVVCPLVCWVCYSA